MKYIYLHFRFSIDFIQAGKGQPNQIWPRSHTWMERYRPSIPFHNNELPVICFALLFHTSYRLKCLLHTSLITLSLLWVTLMGLIGNSFNLALKEV